ncbi:MFS transporter [Alteromonas sp. 38]|uniref:MFS transporter n=1 Tax=unclassified Alteromonas TaxID=2614992 RepID=UPI0012F40977|nr:MULTISPECIES: MFS transporter [unclassified Alteromonas]CAD5270051.1 MFS transporter [Alteromonas sp. 154]VXB96541.1 MFS transporter [Alteromonas sp. 38]
MSKPALPPTKILAALLGIFISAMMAGLNNRVGTLGLVDVRGALGFGVDGGSWITTSYLAGEILITPFATWFAITFSVRRFHTYMVIIIALIALTLPFVNDLSLVIALRFVQGVASGALVPLLMMMALKALPLHIRLHGLALYAMTATFSPNIAIWLTGQWTDEVNNWRLIYWQVIPLCFVAITLVRWGAPKEATKYARFKEGNWLGMGLGVIGMALLTIALTQGERLDWFNSTLITLASINGGALLALYLITEWYHPTPFISLRLLGRRNLGLGSLIFTLILIVFMSATVLPMNFLTAVQDYRVLQSSQLALIIALPQLVLGSVVAILLYKKWVDARVVFAIGLLTIGIACFIGAGITSSWNRDQFLVTQVLQAIGQPMAVVSMLFLMTSVVQPHEGPYFSGIINTLRVLGTLLGGALVGHLLTQRGSLHTDTLIGHASTSSSYLPILNPAELSHVFAQQSLTLSIADIYRLFGVLACLLIPIVLSMTHVPAPSSPVTN